MSMRVALQLAAIALLCSAAHAQVRTGSTMEASTQTAASSKGLTELDAADRVAQEVWGLTAD